MEWSAMAGLVVDGEMHSMKVGLEGDDHSDINIQER